MKAPKPRVRKQNRRPGKASMKMIHSSHETIRTLHMDEKGRPRHRIEHHTRTTYESPTSMQARIADRSY